MIQFSPGLSERKARYGEDIHASRGEERHESTAKLRRRAVEKS